MGFLICNIQPLEGNRVSIRRVRRLALGGANGLLARHLPGIAKAEDMEWTLNAGELLRLDGPGLEDAHGIFFDLASGENPLGNMLQLIKISGRTASLITDALFHFRIFECSKADGVESFAPPGLGRSAECYEHMRLEGGFVGGDWAWGAPPQPLGASVLGPSTATNAH